MSNFIKKGRLTGILFLVPFLAYGIGSGLLETAWAQQGLPTALLWSGIALVALNSAAVMALGVLLFPVLKQVSARIALTYLLARLAEALLLLAGMLVLVNAIGNGEPAAPARELHLQLYQWAMLPGAASLFFCKVLFRLKITPQWLSVLGGIGYFLLALGAIAELMGYPISIWLSIPGGLFELGLGIRLIIKGWNGL